jgi:histone-lysine N-methyltransferase SETDB1
MLRQKWAREWGIRPYPLLYEDISNNQECVAIAAVNLVDDTPFPLSSFRYVTKPVGGEGVCVLGKKEEMVCCDCEDDCRDKEKCPCVALSMDRQAA